MTTDVATGPVEVVLWRDYEASALPMGSATVGTDAVPAAAAFYADGVRRVDLADVVDLASGADAATMAALVLVRELTAWGIAVDWRLRLPADAGGARLLSHLHPPTEVLGLPEVQAAWARDYHFFKCAYRHGPGFVEVRDFRSRLLRKITIGDARYREVIAGLVAGRPLAELPKDIVGPLIEVGLVGLVGASAVWLPYRVRRWPLASDII